MIIEIENNKYKLIKDYRSGFDQPKITKLRGYNEFRISINRAWI